MTLGFSQQVSSIQTVDAQHTQEVPPLTWQQRSNWTQMHYYLFFFHLLPFNFSSLIKIFSPIIAPHLWSNPQGQVYHEQHARHYIIFSTASSCAPGPFICLLQWLMICFHCFHWFITFQFFLYCNFFFQLTKNLLSSHQP